MAVQSGRKLTVWTTELELTRSRVRERSRVSGVDLTADDSPMIHVGDAEVDITQGLDSVDEEILGVWPIFQLSSCNEPTLVQSF